MNTSKEPLPKTPPFIERQSAPLRNTVDTRGMLSIATMLVSLASLTASMLGAGKLVFDIFDDGLASSLQSVTTKLIVLGFSFFFGWIVGLASIRAFGNLVYPYIIKIYSWGCLSAVGLLYLMIIQKLYLQEYDGIHFWAYLAILLGGLAVLLFLHLLVEDNDLRPYAIPLLIISVFQLFAIIYRYVFTDDPQEMMLLGDLTIFLVMIAISALMLMHLGIFAPLRGQLHDWFTKNGNSNHAVNGGEKN